MVDYQALYNQLLYDLNHRIRNYNCTILGLVQANLPNDHKLTLIAKVAASLDELTHEISAKQTQIHP